MNSKDQPVVRLGVYTRNKIDKEQNWMVGRLEAKTKELVRKEEQNR